jgi:hypothetical protein
VRDKLNNTVLSSDVGSFSGHLLSTSIPATHVSFVPHEFDIRGYLTAYRASANTTVVFNTLANGLAATMYSDSSFQSAVRSYDVKNTNFLIESAFTDDSVRLEPQSFYGFRWSGFLKPQEVGIW